MNISVYLDIDNESD